MAKRGRKPKGEFSDNTTVTSIRLRADVREALDRACAASNSSLGQEIQKRVKRTFEEDKSITDAFGSQREYRFFRLISEAMRLTLERESLLPVDQREEASGRHWLDDPERYYRAMHAAIAIFRTLSPGSPELGKEELSMLEMWSQIRGEMAAFTRMHQIAGADPDLPLTAADPEAARDAKARRELGDIINRARGKSLIIKGMEFEVCESEEDEE